MLKEKIFRIGAVFIDASLFNSLISFIISPFLIQVKLGTNLLHDMFIYAILLSIYIIGISLYCVITNKFFSATIGKALLGIKITDENGFKVDSGTSFNREFMKWGFTYGTLGIYAVLCMYNMFNNKPMYHDVKYKTKVC